MGDEYGRCFAQCSEIERRVDSLLIATSDPILDCLTDPHARLMGVLVPGVRGHP